jgi:hypothetical protein
MILKMAARAHLHSEMRRTKVRLILYESELLLEVLRTFISVDFNRFMPFNNFALIIKTIIVALMK